MNATRMLCMLLACLSAGASAQSVYKCRDGQGAVSYQSQACSGRAEKQWDTSPALTAEPSPERLAADRSIERDRQSLKAKQRPARQAKLFGGRQGRSTPSPCERERKARAAAHQRRGVRWSFKDASYWDGRVFGACR